MTLLAVWVVAVAAALFIQSRLDRRNGGANDNLLALAPLVVAGLIHHLTGGTLP